MGPEALRGGALGLNSFTENTYRGRALRRSEDDADFQRQRQTASDQRATDEYDYNKSLRPMRKRALQREEHAAMDEQQANKFKQETLNSFRRYKVQGDITGLEETYNNHYPNGEQVRMTVIPGKDPGAKMIRIESDTGDIKELPEDEFLGLVSEMYDDPAKFLQHQREKEMEATKFSNKSKLESQKFENEKSLKKLGGGAQGSSEIQMINALAENKFNGDKGKAIEAIARENLYTKLRSADTFSDDDVVWQRVDATMKRLYPESSGSNQQPAPGQNPQKGAPGAGAVDPRKYPRTSQGYEQYLRAKYPGKSDAEYKQRVAQVWQDRQGGGAPQQSEPPRNQAVNRLDGLRPREVVNAPPVDPQIQIQKDIQNTPRTRALDQTRMASRFNISSDMGNQDRGDTYGFLAQAETNVQNDIRKGIIPDQEDIQSARDFANGKGDHEKLQVYDALIQLYYGGR